MTWFIKLTSRDTFKWRTIVEIHWNYVLTKITRACAEQINSNKTTKSLKLKEFVSNILHYTTPLILGTSTTTTNTNWFRLYSLCEFHDFSFQNLLQHSWVWQLFVVCDECRHRNEEWWKFNHCIKLWKLSIYRLIR